MVFFCYIGNIFSILTHGGKELHFQLKPIEWILLYQGFKYFIKKKTMKIYVATQF